MGPEMWNWNFTHINIMNNRGQRFDTFVKSQLISPEVNINPTSLFSISHGTAQKTDIEIL